MSDEKCTEFKIRLTHDEPIELKTMAVSLLSLQELIDGYTSKEHGISDSKIYLDKVEVGSDIYSLIFQISAEALPLIAPLKVLKEVIDIMVLFKDYKDKSLYETENNPYLTPKNATLLKDILAPVIINQNTYNISHADNIIFSIGADDAKKMTQNAELIAEVEQAEQCKEYKNVLINFKIVKDAKRIVRDSAVCEAVIKNRSIPTEIINIDDKELVNKSPFDNYYLVDLLSFSVEGIVKFYRVTAIHSIIPKQKDSK
ncbi:hypothetical protein KDD93_07630 [Campylobacter sp. faydin G-24]|uniref:RloG protein n=1 Tax=Campylobacter anatolicus TaxID=2829105 RepID=A0ABS5HJL6_9BACT|nr:hypothetical protein [Campylobacter anatolicus]MBR8461516.1 hypothetical protein [Campylobacter anatolicus]MBR8464433.1 hypothetical protein [Campylobacter anatolicus]MBR8466220.1 hypothetical protein [Campylobacter anatolicus]